MKMPPDPEMPPRSESAEDPAFEAISEADGASRRLDRENDRSSSGTDGRARAVPGLPDADGNVVEAEPPIFIGGAGRSGTTLVRTILTAHPRIAIGPEFKATPLVAKQWAKFKAFLPYLEKQFGVPESAIDEAYADLITTLMGHGLRRWSSAPRLGEKTPGNVFVFLHLHELFPNARLINVIRDGRDVVRSLLAREDWIHPDTEEKMEIIQSPEAAAEYWKTAVLHGLAAQRKLGDTGVITTVRYEELVTEPEHVARTLCEFVDEPWTEEMLRIEEFDDHPYFEDGHRPIDDTSVGRWEGNLTETQKDAIKEVAGDLLKALGYVEGNDW